MNPVTLEKFDGKKVSVEVRRITSRNLLQEFVVKGILRIEYYEDDEIEVTIESADEAIALEPKEIVGIELMKEQPDDPIRKRVEAYKKSVVPVAKAFQEGMKKLDDKGKE